MPEINYCQNLWAQYMKVISSQNISRSDVLAATRENIDKIQDAMTSLARFETELTSLREVWDNSYKILEDGRKLFGPEYNALQRLISKFKESDDSLEYFYDQKITISSAGFLVKISLSDTTVADLSDLSVFVHLENLYVDDLENTDISSLRKLGRMKSLYIMSDRLTNDDLVNISELTNLRSLTLGSEKITDISALHNLSQLESLDINGTWVSETKTIEAMTNLRSLDISNTPISDISGLEKLQHLRRLQLFTFKAVIEDYSVLLKLPNLNYLEIEIVGGINPEYPEQFEVFEALKRRGVKVEGV